MKLFKLTLAIAIIYAGLWYVARHINIYEFIAIAVVADFSVRVLAPMSVKEIKARREIRALNRKYRS